SSKDARAIALEALDAVNLKEWAGHLPAELSGGQQQRVTIARAFAHQPALILADEPTGNLDTTTSDSVMDLLVNLNREKGITFVIVTHEEDVARRCTRLVTIQDGLITSDERLVEIGNSEEE
ncbi:MAG: ABC transporter ATP-binding protein, partial [Methanobacteriota archaeon]